MDVDFWKWGENKGLGENLRIYSSWRDCDLKWRDCDLKWRDCDLKWDAL
jgi:hypothetical protein